MDVEVALNNYVELLTMCQTLHALSRLTSFNPHAALGDATSTIIYIPIYLKVKI